MCYRENAQKGFLVVTGGCILIVEEQERRLRTWDCFHCAGGTPHIIVGAGEEAAIVVAADSAAAESAAASPIRSRRSPMGRF